MFDCETIDQGVNGDDQGDRQRDGYALELWFARVGLEEIGCADDDQSADDREDPNKTSGARYLAQEQERPQNHQGGSRSPRHRVYQRKIMIAIGK